MPELSALSRQLFLRRTARAADELSESLLELLELEAAGDDNGEHSAHLRRCLNLAGLIAEGLREPRAEVLRATEDVLTGRPLSILIKAGVARELIFVRSGPPWESLELTREEYFAWTACGQPQPARKWRDAYRALPGPGGAA